MHFLRDNFLIFSVCGCWTPDSARGSKCKSAAYKIYSLTLFSLTLILVSMKVFDLVTGGVRNFEELAVKLFVLPDFVCAIIKFVNFSRKEKDVLAIETVFLQCASGRIDVEEAKIQMQFDNLCR